MKKSDEEIRCEIYRLEELGKNNPRFGLRRIEALKWVLGEE